MPGTALTVHQTSNLKYWYLKAGDRILYRVFDTAAEAEAHAAELDKPKEAI
jgi:hypothetical protein